MSDQKIYFYDDSAQDVNVFHSQKKNRGTSNQQSPKRSDEPGPSDDSRTRRRSKSRRDRDVTAESGPPKEIIALPAAVPESSVKPSVSHDLNENIRASGFDGDDEELLNPAQDKDDLLTKQKIQDMFLYSFFLIICCLIVFWMSSSSAFFMTNAMTRGFMETPFVKIDDAALPTMPPIATEATPSKNPSGTTRKSSKGKSTTKKSGSKPKSTTRSSSKGKSTTKSSSKGKSSSEKPKKKPKPDSFRSELGLDYVTDPYYEYEDEVEEEDYVDEEEEELEELLESGRRALPDEPPGGFVGGSEPLPQVLRDSVMLGDFWDFAETTLINLLFWDFWYSYKNPIKHTEKDDKLIFYSSQLLGVARLRQLRVRPDSCTIHPEVENLFKSCYGYYSSDAEDTANFLPVNPVTETREAWDYTSPDDLETLSYYGLFGTYGTGGFVQDLTLDRSASLQRVQELKNNLWIDRGTRAVIVDFTVYNPNVNLFVVSKIVVEIPPTGGIYPISNFYALKFFRYVSTDDLVILGFEIMFIFFIVYYTTIAVLDVAATKLRYFQHGWNYLEILILALGFTCIIMGFYRFFVIEPMVQDLMKLKTTHAQFDFPRSIQTSFDQCCAVFLFFVFIKIFRFLRVSSTVDELSRTLTRSLKSILTFAGMFLVFFMAFALMAYLIFGTKVYEYRTVWLSTMTLFQAVLGKFNYRAMEEADYVLGPIFLILFVFFVFFLLMNMFGAIMIESYKTVRSQIVPVRRKMVPSYLGRAVAKIFPCTAKSDPGDDALTTVEIIKDSLFRAGFTKTEIEIFFAKYDIRMDQDITEQTAKQLITKLELRKFDFEPIVPEVKTIIELQREIERLSQVVAEIDKKVTQV